MPKKPVKPGLRRRDATGHLDPRYAAELLEQSRENQASDPPPAGFVHGKSDELAEDLGEHFVQAATSAEDGDEDAGDELIQDEPVVPDGDDDDIDFGPEELAFPRMRSKPTSPERSRGTVPSKVKATRSSPVKEAGKQKKGRGSSSSNAKRSEATKAKASKAKHTPKKAKKKSARKATKRVR